jgi:isopentenyl-diphosphate Delta-isomerase
MLEEVILVDENDRIVGRAEKVAAHLNGSLHRAFSIFVFDKSGRLLVQKRARTKYHSASLWSNTCCSHPRPGETTSEAAHRRLKEEMGFNCELREVFDVTYRVQLDNNLFEHEFDHIFVGTFDGDPQPDEREVEDWRWIAVRNLVAEVGVYPHRYSYWLRILIKESLLRLLPAFQDDLALAGPDSTLQGAEGFRDWSRKASEIS